MIILTYKDCCIKTGAKMSKVENQYVAWIEAGGFTKEDLEQRLRISKLEQNQITLIGSELENLTGLAGGEIPNFIAQENWLSNHVLLLQIGVPGVERYLLVACAPDPSFPLDPALGANQSIPLAEGGFTGFLYP